MEKQSLIPIAMDIYHNLVVNPPKKALKNNPDVIYVRERDIPKLKQNLIHKLNEPHQKLKIECGLYDSEFYINSHVVNESDKLNSLAFYLNLNDKQLKQLVNQF